MRSSMGSSPQDIRAAALLFGIVLLVESRTPGIGWELMAINLKESRRARVMTQKRFCRHPYLDNWFGAISITAPTRERSCCFQTLRTQATWVIFRRSG